uniref:Uncharacterized protein n=1 Tax=Zea mays TaxID=4577 RepID=C0PA07_MAIZE|nr:unknown [Zea mays]
MKNSILNSYIGNALRREREYSSLSTVGNVYLFMYMDGYTEREENIRAQRTLFSHVYLPHAQNQSRSRSRVPRRSLSLNLLRILFLNPHRIQILGHDRSRNLHRSRILILGQSRNRSLRRSRILILGQSRNRSLRRSQILDRIHFPDRIPSQTQNPVPGPTHALRHIQTLALARTLNPNPLRTQLLNPHQSQSQSRRRRQIQHTILHQSPHWTRNLRPSRSRSRSQTPSQSQSHRHHHHRLCQC